VTVSLTQCDIDTAVCSITRCDAESLQRQQTRAVFQLLARKTCAMDVAEIAVGRGFETCEEVEEAVKRLENEHYHPFRCFNSQSVKEYNHRFIQP